MDTADAQVDDAPVGEGHERRAAFGLADHRLGWRTLAQSCLLERRCPFAGLPQSSLSAIVLPAISSSAEPFRSPIGTLSRSARQTRVGHGSPCWSILTANSSMTRRVEQISSNSSLSPKICRQHFGRSRCTACCRTRNLSETEIFVLEKFPETAENSSSEPTVNRR